MGRLRQPLIITIVVLSAGFAPVLATPTIDVQPVSLNVTLPEDFQVLEVMTISNDGTSPLEYSISDTAFWVAVLQASGNVDPGESVEVEVLFSSIGLDLGTYENALRIISNDFTQPVTLIPLTMEVALLPEISVGVDSLDFGAVIIGTPESLSFDVTNFGGIDLVVSSVSSQTAEFSSPPGVLTIPPGEAASVNVTFVPPASGPFADVLSIESNDPFQPLIQLPMAGFGVDPPVIGIAPPSLDSTLPEGGSETQVLAISNTGPIELHYSIASAWLTSPASPTAVFINPEPREGTVGAFGAENVDAHLVATGLPPGSYDARLLVSSNDTVNPLVFVPTTLTVTSAPMIRIPGPEVVLESTMDYDSSGATTRHGLVVSELPVGEGTLELLVNGEFGSPANQAIATVEGSFASVLGGGSVDCVEYEAMTTLREGRLAGLAANGVVDVDVENADGVDPICPINRHVVRLTYVARLSHLDFGLFEDPLGGGDLPVEVFNKGSVSLDVTSVSSDTVEFTASPSSFSVAPGGSETVTVTFTGTGAGGHFSGTLAISSNDPDDPLVTVALSGISGCIDSDSDGLSTCDGDCDDTNPNCTTDCTDADADGFCVTTDCDDGNATCTVDCTDADADGICAETDCDESNPTCGFDCTDADADGICVTADCDDANANCMLNCNDFDDDGFCTDLDCDDVNANCTTDCADADGDGLCVTTDCDDLNGNCTTDCTDADSDGFCVTTDCDEANANCTSDCTDDDLDSYCVTADCDDGNDNCTTDCTDGDGDGFCVTTDCDDLNGNCTSDCTDADSDGFCITTDCDEGNGNCTTDCTDADEDGFCVTTDCDETVASCNVNCDDLDEDGSRVCDGDCDDANPNCDVDCTDADSD
jgi:hypothetical protein